MSGKRKSTITLSNACEKMLSSKACEKMTMQKTLGKCRKKPDTSSSFDMIVTTRGHHLPIAC